MQRTSVTTTDSIVKDDYKLKRTAHEIAADIDEPLTIEKVGANRFKVAGETFKSRELAGEFIRQIKRVQTNKKKSNATNT